MSSTEAFIRKAVEGGWLPRQFKDGRPFKIVAAVYPTWKSTPRHGISFVEEGREPGDGAHYKSEELLLDPSLWRCAGKALGWGRIDDTSRYDTTAWKSHWHGLLDHLDEGKDVESYLATLITGATETE